MENKNPEALVIKVIATLDAILNKMADVLDSSFDPSDPESMKLLREFRATMNSRRSWVKFCSVNDENENSCNVLSKKVETSANNQPAATVQKPVIMNKSAKSLFDEMFFKGTQGKNNKAAPQVDLNSGLVCYK